MKLVRARAYSSIANLGHGFDVFGVGVTVAWDEVELTPRRRGLAIEIDGAGTASISTRPARNTAGLALASLMKEYGIDRGLRVRITKHRVTGGGLGSSASSAAAAVVAANRLFGLGLGRAALVPHAARGEIAAAGSAHADNVAAAIHGGFVVVDQDDSTRILHVRPPAHLRFAIAIPRLALTTAAARRALPRRISIAEHSQGCARAATIVAAMLRGDIAALGGALAGSFAERARARLVPGFADVCRSACRAGAAGATFSGAGPAVMAVVDATRSDPHAVADAMVAAFGRADLDAEGYVGRPAPAARVVEAR